MKNIDDEAERFIDESMPFIFDSLGDLTALTEHGCLTVAQCALLMPAMLTKSRPGDASEIAAHYTQLALLDIAEGELSPKHPETLLPYSQYLRMMESGMYGVNGESLPMPTVDWLVPLDEAARWLKSKGIDVNFEGLMAELGEGNTAPEQNTATPVPVVDVAELVKDGLLTKEIADIFDGLNDWDAKRWPKNLSASKWLHPARTALGGAGVASSVWNPLTLAQLLHDKTRGAKPKEKLMQSLKSRFSRYPALEPWRDDFNEYFTTFCTTD